LISECDFIGNLATGVDGRGAVEIKSKSSLITKSDFINNTVPFSRLSSSMDLGKEGEQVVLVSEKAISRLRYEGCDPIDPAECFRRRCERDIRARTRYLGREERGGIDEYDIMMDDIISGRVKGDDPRLQ
jgi:hypothetical protein